MNRLMLGWILLMLIAVIAAIGCPSSNNSSGEPSQGDDDSGAGDDSGLDDDASSKGSLTIYPIGQTVPAGASEPFSTYWEPTSGSPVWNPSGVVWETEDHAVATVNSNGMVTGISPGLTKLRAVYNGILTKAKFRVGPDAFVVDTTWGVLAAVDRIAHYSAFDILGMGDSKNVLGSTLNWIAIADGYAYIVNSADSGVGITGEESLVVVDLLNRIEIKNIPLPGADSPWAVTELNGRSYVTINLSDRLDIIDNSTLLDISSVDLGQGCRPNGLVAAAGKIYVGCSGYTGAPNAYNPGKVVVYNPITGNLGEILTSQVNPGNVVATADGKYVYVSCTGNWADLTGMIDKIDTSTDSVVNSFALGIAPLGITIGPDGIAYVGEGMAGNIYVFNTANNDQILRGTDNPVVIGGVYWIQCIAANPEENTLWICDQGNNYVIVIDPVSGSFYSVPVDGPVYIAFD